MRPFSSIYNTFMALGYHQNFNSAHYLLNESMEVDQILHMIILTLSRSRLGLLRIHFCKFTTQLWPLDYVNILFPLNPLKRIDEIRPNFADALMLSRSSLGLLHINFSQTYNTVMVLDYC